MMNHLRILIVDDHPISRLLLRQQLLSLGFTTITTAKNGLEALEQIKHTPFDIIFTDCSMPKMDGYQLTRTIRRDIHLQDLLIVGFTADARPEASQQALASGMNDCLVKPVDLDQLRCFLLEHLDAIPSLKAPLHIPLSVKNNSDLQSILASFSGGDRHIETAFLTTLLTTNQEDTLSLQHAIDSKNHKEAAALTHKIKGGAKLVRAETLIHHCEILERSLAKENTDKLGSELAGVIQSLDILNAQLQALLAKSS
jgi:two-component system, NarL family, sensor histidine kinase EvgS